MSAKNFKKLETPTKIRNEFPVIGSVRLFKKKEAAPKDAKGIILRPLKPDGKTDYTADGYLIWLSGVDALLTGGVVEINAFLVKYEPKPDA